MGDIEYKTRLLDFKMRLGGLLNERAALEVRMKEIETQIEHVKKVISGLSALAGQAENPNDLTGLGFTDACRAVLRNSAKAMTPVEVRDALAAKGYDLKPYSNPLASIHTILKRLAESGEVQTLTRGFETLYQWRKVPLRRRRPGVPFAPPEPIVEKET